MDQPHPATQCQWIVQICISNFFIRRKRFYDNKRATFDENFWDAKPDRQSNQNCPRSLDGPKHVRFLPRFALLILNREPAKASIISGFVVCENSLTRRNKRQHCCSFCRVCLLCNFASNQFSLSLYRLLKLRRNLKLFITERRNVAINRCIVTCTFKWIAI